MASNLLVTTPLPIAAKEYVELISNVEVLYSIAFAVEFPRSTAGLIWPGALEHFNRDAPLRISGVFVDSLTTQLSGIGSVPAKAFEWIYKVWDAAKKVIHYQETGERILAEADKLWAEAERTRAEAEKVRAETLKVKVEVLNSVGESLRAMGYSEVEIRAIMARGDGALSGIIQATETKQLVGVGMN